MDPNETLHRLREEIARYNETHDAYDEQRTLVDAITDLDEWLSKGGFLPDDWRPFLSPRFDTQRQIDIDNAYAEDQRTHQG